MLPKIELDPIDQQAKHPDQLNSRNKGRVGRGQFREDFSHLRASAIATAYIFAFFSFEARAAPLLLAPLKQQPPLENANRRRLRPGLAPRPLWWLRAPRLPGEMVKETARRWDTRRWDTGSQGRGRG
jgi:hypothetical protein